MLERIIQELLHNRNNPGFIIIEGTILDKEDMIKAYKRFLLDWMLDKPDQIKQLKQLRIWNI